MIFFKQFLLSLAACLIVSCCNYQTCLYLNMIIIKPTVLAIQKEKPPFYNRIVVLNSYYKTDKLCNSLPSLLTVFPFNSMNI